MNKRQQTIPLGSKRQKSPGEEYDQLKSAYDVLCNKYEALKVSDEELSARYRKAKANEEELARQIEELHQAKTQLEQNECLLNESQRIAHLGSYILNLDNSTWSCSGTLYEVFGIDVNYPHNINGWMQTIHPADRDAVVEHMNYVIEHKRNFNKEYRIIKQSTKEERWVHGRGTLKYNDDGDPVEMLGIIQDITERKRFEKSLEENQFALKQQNEEYIALNEELSESNRRILQMNMDLAFAKEKAEISEKRVLSRMDNMLEGCHIIDFNKRFIYINPAAEKHNRVPKEKIVGKLITEAWPYIESLPLYNHIMDCLEKRISIRTENEFVLLDGQRAWFELSLEPVPEGALILGIDITERKLTELQLMEKNSLIENFFNTTIELLCIANMDGYFIRLNKEWENVLQYDISELEGNSYTNFVHPEDLESTLKAMSSLRQNNVLNFKNRFRCKNGDYRWIEWKAAPLGDKIFAAARDVTESLQRSIELTKAKEKAEESDRLKSAFLHNISHEIRTPMNAIIGFSEFLNKPDLNPDKRRHYTDIIIRSSNQLLSIITDIVNIATIESGQAKLEPTEFDLNSTLNLLYQQFALKAQEKNISLYPKPGLPNEDALVYTDGTKLTEVLTNLIGNAIKFTQTGSVKFGYRLNDNKLQFFVEDTGIGIPAEMHEEIFKRFRQVEYATYRQFDGFGLGLSISKAYIELLGGNIWLTSEPGVGSTFYFTVPYVKVEPVNKHGSTGMDKVSALNEKTILIVEDEGSNIILLEELLSETGLNLILLKAKNGLEAVEMCRTNPDIDLVLMDIKMPLMDGYEATREIKKFRPNLPIIAQTAYSREDDRIKALSVGCDDTIVKPINQEVFVDKVIQQIDASMFFKS